MRDEDAANLETFYLILWTCFARTKFQVGAKNIVRNILPKDWLQRYSQRISIYIESASRNELPIAVNFLCARDNEGWPESEFLIYHRTSAGGVAI